MGCFRRDPVDPAERAAERTMSLHERLAYVGNASDTPSDLPYSISCIYTYPLEALPSRDALSARAHEMHQKMEHLNAVVDGDKLRLAPSDQEYVTDADAPTDISALLSHELTRASMASGARPCQITRYLADKVGFVALTTYHWFADGTATLRLAEMLLLDKPIPVEPGLAPRMEDCVRIKPGLGMVAKVVYHELVKPLFTKNESWPGVIPKGIKPSRSVVFPPLDAAALAALKTWGKEHGIATLNPILQTALMTALWREVGKPARFNVMTPRRERREDGHEGLTHATGVSISVFTTEVRYTAHSDFAAEARKVAAVTSDPRRQQKAREMIGMLAYLPGDWEQYYRDKLAREAPYTTSIAVSNLGLTRLPRGCSDMVWGQSAYPFAEPVVASLIGHEGGLRTSFAFRDGSAMTAEQVERVGIGMHEVLMRFNA